MIPAWYPLRRCAAGDLRRNPLRCLWICAASPRPTVLSDYAMLEYCIREDLKLKRPRMMAVLDPLKLVIDNYPEGQTEELEAPNNMENEALGSQNACPSERNCISSGRISWWSLRRNTNVSIRAMRCG